MWFCGFVCWGFTVTMSKLERWEPTIWSEEKLNTHGGTWNAAIVWKPTISPLSTLHKNHAGSSWFFYATCEQIIYSQGLTVSPLNQAQGAKIIRNFTPKKIEKLVQLHEGCAVYSWHAVMSPLKLDCFKGTT